MTRPRFAASVSVALLVLLAGCGALPFLPGTNANTDTPRLITEDGALTVDSAPTQSIRGTTDLGTGEQVAVRLRASGDHPFLKSESTTVDAAGDFSATFDFSDVPPGTTFGVTVRHNGTVLIESTGQVTD